MSFSELLVKNTWFLFFIIGIIFIYFFWITPECNNIRIKEKLTNTTGSDDNIKKFIKSNFLIFYILNRVFLVIFSIFTSIGITIMFWYSAKGKPINSLYDTIGLAIPIFSFYLLLCGVKDNCSEEDDSKFKILLDIKLNIISIFIKLETKLYIKCIHKVIRKWYESDNNKHEFAALIIRMSDDSFVDILRNACNPDSSVSKTDGAAKSVLYERPIEIMEDYNSQDTNMNVLTNIQILIDKYFELDNCEPYKITNFISNNEICCKNKNKDDILINIQAQVSNASNRYENTNPMEKNKFNSLFEDDSIVSNVNLK